MFVFLPVTEQVLTGLGVGSSVASTFVLWPRSLPHVGLRLGQLAALRRVGRGQQAGRIQRQAFVRGQVGLAREGVLQLQTLQLLRQNRLAAAQV